jgi:hypothetical protein
MDSVHDAKTIAKLTQTKRPMIFFMDFPFQKSVSCLLIQQSYKAASTPRV